MIQKLVKFGLAVALLGAMGAAQAGHLFNQATTNLNAPVTLSQGSTLGVQPSQTPFNSSSTPRLDVYGGLFNTGDQLRVQWGNGANDSIVMTAGGTGCNNPAFSSSIIFFGCSSLLTSMPAVLSSLGAALNGNGAIALTALTGSMRIDGYVFRAGGVQWQGRFTNQVGTNFTSSVPEPATMAVLGLGLLGVAATGLRRRRQSVPVAA